MPQNPNTPALAADHDALVAQLSALRDDVSRLASQIGVSAAQTGKAMAESVTTGLHDARLYAGHKAQETNLRIEHAVTANPYLALGLAGGLGLLLGLLTRR